MTQPVSSRECRVWFRAERQREWIRWTFRASELENAWHSPAAREPEVLWPKKNLGFEARDSNARPTEGARTVEVRDSRLMSAE